MRKKVLVIALVLVLALSGAFARGPGGLSALGIFGTVSGSTTGSTGGGIGLSAKFGSFPVLGIQYDFTGARFALSCDYYALDAVGLFGPFSCFVGVGAYGGMAFGQNMDFDLGLRFPLGLQLWPVPRFELFIAAVPVVPLLPTPSVGVGAEGGLRIHF